MLIYSFEDETIQTTSVPYYPIRQPIQVNNQYRIYYAPDAYSILLDQKDDVHLAPVLGFEESYSCLLKDVCLLNNNKLFYCLEYSQRNQEGNIGWRYSYRRKITQYYIKDFDDHTNLLLYEF